LKQYGVSIIFCQNKYESPLHAKPIT